MAHSVSLPGHLAASSQDIASEKAVRVPWYIWNFALAATSATIGGTWDISWHASIGRDTFWTPAHMAIYLCGLLAGFGSAYLILDTTFGSGRLRAASVRMWGFRGPLGAFLATWGAVAMLASAPFDDWWHNAYGLDVKILSPPHSILIFGIVAIKFGALLLALGAMNRASGALRARLEWVFLYVGALMARDMVGVFLEYLSRNQMHSARYYLVVSLTAPLGLTAVARASRHRWGTTIVAAILTVLGLGFLWILPLFPAEPKLGPVYRQVTHFIPVGGFPMLLLAPALALDLLRRRAEPWNRWKLALAGGALFLGTFLAVQWPFASFLQSPAARNWVFGAHYLPYFVPARNDVTLGVFTAIEKTPAEFWTRMALAAVAAVLSVRLGLAWGEGMRRIRR
ncbi:MAG: hypothetical protein HYR60_30635 [Acidobacteria bacterium]|nr:hypothetical protein [Acidobacteriota bacterium]MBI3472548.1 hypothetical protein [Candidatus Solibacter usitatus]